MHVCMCMYVCMYIYIYIYMCVWLLYRLIQERCLGWLKSTNILFSKCQVTIHTLFEERSHVIKHLFHRIG